MLTDIRKTGLLPLVPMGTTVTADVINTLKQSAVSYIVFHAKDRTGLESSQRFSALTVGITEVSCLEEAKAAFLAGAKFMVVKKSSAELESWAKAAGLCVVPENQLVGGILTLPSEVLSNSSSLQTWIQKAIRTMLSFDLRHVGINCPNEEISSRTASQFEQIFGFPKEDRGGAYFAGDIIEVMKKPFYGTHGHIAISTASAESAAYYLEQAGVKLNWQSAGYNPDGRLRVVYLQEEIGGFAVHILQR